jgi:hypothetical protein
MIQSLSSFSGEYLRISKDGRLLETENGKPFFWQGETAWLAIQKLSQPDIELYLNKRKTQGFNVLQVCALHDVNDEDFYHNKALRNGNLVMPRVTNGNDFKAGDSQYDYWDHLVYLVDECAKREMYVAIVPVWGSVLKKTKPSPGTIRIYMNLLCQKLEKKKNVIWLLGGDIQGELYPELWEEMVGAIRTHNSKQLISFHPRGRTSSVTWFHEKEWLAFDMCQSGHKDYEQDPEGYGEDNWKYVRDALACSRQKPIIDGEISYEDIPHGLHDTTAVRWTGADIRRYAYWSVFTGSNGITYGHNSVMQFYDKEDLGISSYGARGFWHQCLDSEGANDLHYLKQLMTNRLSDRQDISDYVLNQGERYERIVATKGGGYILCYTFTGKQIQLPDVLFKNGKWTANWFNPRNGIRKKANHINIDNGYCFVTEWKETNGNDWVLEIVW